MAVRGILVIQREDVRAVCPVDEVHGIHQFHPQQAAGCPGDGREIGINVHQESAALARALGRDPERPASVHCPEAELRVSVEDLKHVSMIDLFRIDAEGQAEVLTTGLLALERDPKAADQLEACMRAAHSLKGAARIVGLTAGVRVAHALEDCFVAAQSGRIGLRQQDIDRLLRGVDLLVLIAKTPESDTEQWNGRKAAEVDACLATLDAVLAQSESPESAALRNRTIGQISGAAASSQARSTDRVLRVTAESLNRLLGLAGESRVKSALGEGILRIAAAAQEAASRNRPRARQPSRCACRTMDWTAKPRRRWQKRSAGSWTASDLLADRLADLDVSMRGSVNLSHRLYAEALACRMRPFGDVVQGLPRLVRDLSRSLGKQVKLGDLGEATQVDRDILGKARSAARTSSSQCHRSRHRVSRRAAGGRQSRGRAFCGSRRVTAPAISRSSLPTTGVASTFSGCGRASSSEN